MSVGEKNSFDKFDIVTSGSLLDDIKKVDIAISKVPDIEVKEVVIKETGNFLNLRENIINIPIEMIVFPFFTPQKQNKRVNFAYSFEDLGVTMYCTLVAKDSKDKVFQPSIFEEKIYTFLIAMYEAKSDVNNTDEYIEFEISDFIVNFLGNKMNRNYYSKVEQALKNLKNTEYQFVVSNHTKLGKYKFEDEEFKLLTYQKLKIGKKVIYRVTLNNNIRKKIKDKRYIKYNSKALLEILAKDPIAGRIYKYISKIRYEKKEDRINIRTLAAIIPLKTEQETERFNKQGEKRIYTLSRMKQVLKRIEKAFIELKKLGYIKRHKTYEKKSEDTYYIQYEFNPEKDGSCHISTYVESKKKNVDKIEWEETPKVSRREEVKVKPKQESRLEKEVEEAEIIEEVKVKRREPKRKTLTKHTTNYENFPENVVEKIRKAKKNTYVSKAWNKRVDNKILKILLEDGDKVAIEILENLYKGLKNEIKKTLVQYINGILKNLRKEEKEVSKLKSSQISLFNSGVEKPLISKQRLKAARRQLKKPVVSTSTELGGGTGPSRINDPMIEFDKLNDYEKLNIEKRALEICSEETGTKEKFLLEIKEKSISIYKATMKEYMVRAIEEYFTEKA